MMKTKFALILLTFLVLSCTSSRPVVRTKAKPKVTAKKQPVVQSKSVAKSVTKPISKPVEKPVNSTVSTTNEIKPTADSEVSLVATSNVKTYAEEIKLYVDDFKEIAQNNMRAHGIPASIILAQGILESGAGKGKLALSANNHFGIKCHKEWTGESVKHDDDAAQECFRKYEEPSESYRDHSLFLTSRPRYSSLFKLDKGDYESWAKGLKSAGYATDVKYPDKLIGIIERFELFKYDNEVLSRDFNPLNKETLPTQKSEFYTIQQGDTLYSLSKKFSISVNELKKINKFSDNTISIGQQIKVK